MIGNQNKRVSVAGSVIQAPGTVDFEDGLRMGVLPEVIVVTPLIPGSVPITSWRWGLVLGVNQIPTCLVLRISGINLQLLCDVRNEKLRK